MRKETRQPHMESLSALVLFVVFAACILSVLLTGAGAYRRLTERDDRSYGRRTAVQYIAARVRQADRTGGVSVEDFGGVSALVLPEELDGEIYLTRIYCHDGAIRELFTGADAELAPEEGARVLAADGLAFALKDGLLQAELRDQAGETTRLTLSLRSGEGAAP